MRNKFIFNITFVICVLNIITAHSDTIKVSSEKLNFYRDSNISVFSGNVYAEDNTVKLWSDKISMFYDETKKSVYEIVAENNVKIVVNGVTSHGDFAKYQVDNEELLLEGNKIQSDQLILDLATSTSIMTANTNNRVTAQINKLNNEE